MNRLLRILPVIRLSIWLLLSLPNLALKAEQVTMKMWVDSEGGSVTIEDLPEQDFTPLSEAKFSSIRHTYYLSLEGNTIANSDPAWLSVGVFDSLTLYYRRSDGKWRSLQRGLLVDYDKATLTSFRAFQQDKYGFPLDWSIAHQATFYLRIKNTVRFEGDLQQLRLVDYDHCQVQRASQSVPFLFTYTIFFGVFAFFIAFSLLQFAQHGDSAYLYYATYLGLVVIYFWWKFEKANAFLNVIFTKWPLLYYYWEAPLGILIYLSYFYFLIHFLGAREQLPRFYRMIQRTTPWLLLFIPIHLFVVLTWGLPLGWEMIYWLRLVLLPMGFYAVYQVFTTRHRLAFYVFSGSIAVLIGGLITTVLSKGMAQHYLGYWDIPLLPIQLGVFVELLFFSAGLAFKGRMLGEEKLQLQLDLNQKKVEAEQLRRRKQLLNRLYSRLSHEFRTPLTVIKGALRPINNNRQEKLLIRRYADQMLDAVNQLLDLHKLEEEQLQVCYEHGDVSLLFRYLTTSLQVLAQRKKQAFTLSGCDDKIMMDYDKQKLSSIFTNLCSNAIKHCPTGSTIDVRISQTTVDMEARLVLSVLDDGPGINQGYQDQIFKAFIQVPQTVGGTGIGLNMVRDYCRLLGGQVKLQSKPGNGAHFQVELPLLTNDIKARHALPTPSATEPATAQSMSLKPAETIGLKLNCPSVLVVEDNEDVVFVLKALLQEAYNILTAGDGEEGWQKANTYQPDLIISDVLMPRKDGYELCRMLKQQTSTRGIPLILLTACELPAQRLEGIAVLADAYISKPYSEAELLLTIQTLLEKRTWVGDKDSILSQLTGKSLQADALSFMHRLHEILASNLADSSFKVNELCRALGTNHVSLNKKIKAFTSQTTASYIRNFRLHHARQLLETTNYTVAEVAYRVGFSEASNFGNLFRKTFGISPGEWKCHQLQNV